MGVDSEDFRGDLGVLAEEAVAVADLDHEEDVGVAGLEVEDLELERGVVRVFLGEGAVRGGGCVEELGDEFLMEGGVGLGEG